MFCQLLATCSTVQIGTYFEGFSGLTVVITVKVNKTLE